MEDLEFNIEECTFKITLEEFERLLTFKEDDEVSFETFVKSAESPIESIVLKYKKPNVLVMHNLRKIWIEINGCDSVGIYQDSNLTMTGKISKQKMIFSI